MDMQRGMSSRFRSVSAHIADALGITITHASRTLGTLRREGLISLARERLTVHNKQDLANVALLPIAATGE